MKLLEVFQQLSMGELSMLAIGGSETGGEITEENGRKIAGSVSLGLTALYKRFRLKKGAITVSLQPNKFVYKLESQYAVAGLNSTEPVRWIQDSSDNPFMDDIIKITEVLTDVAFPFKLNDYTDDFSIATPTMTSIRVPDDIINDAIGLPDWYRTDTLTVKYLANHPAILPKRGTFRPERIDIELPESHLQALLYFVASRAHNPVGMGQEFAAGNQWFAKYENECLRLEGEGHQIDDSTGNTRARRAGWP